MTLTIRNPSTIAAPLARYSHAVEIPNKQVKHKQSMPKRRNPTSRRVIRANKNATKVTVKAQDVTQNFSG